MSTLNREIFATATWTSSSDDTAGQFREWLQSLHLAVLELSDSDGVVVVEGPLEGLQLTSSKPEDPSPRWTRTAYSVKQSHVPKPSYECVHYIWTGKLALR